MDYQLRRYRIRRDAMESFLNAWTSGVVPLREQFGFVLHGAWVIDDTNEFVWIIGHEDFIAVDSAYYDSAERAALDPDPAQYIEEGQQTMMRRVL